MPGEVLEEIKGLGRGEGQGWGLLLSRRAGSKKDTGLYFVCVSLVVIILIELVFELMLYYFIRVPRCVNIRWVYMIFW